jgi:autotransporter-associated beta strand protein
VDFSPWVAAFFRRISHLPRTARSPSRRHRLALDVLVDRVAPATLMVNTLTDSIGGSQLSLRDAILAVDGGSYSGPASGQISGPFGSDDTILFKSGLNGTLSLVTASGPLVISSDVTITADPTLSAITISGQFAGNQTGVFEVTSAATATIAGLTITQGRDSTNLFGGISVQAGGNLTVNGCTFVNNQSMGAGGGAILNAGTLNVTDSTFNSNSGVVGGAIDNISGATATLINCTISGNQATSASGTGGGVANAGTIAMLNTLVAQNTSAGSDPDVVGAFTSSGHNLIGNATGSAGLTDGSNGDQVGSAAPFTGNLTSGLATIENISSTAGLVVGQLITDTAGAIPSGTVIAVLGTHSLTLSQAAASSQTGDTFLSAVYANLGPLQNNGGGIQTMALLPTSSGIDAGANTDPVLTVPTVDQRGVSRSQAGTVDIGAVEANELLVTNLNDSGAGSLRDALTQSNSIPGTVLIDFQAGLSGTISLTSARLEVDHDDWIRGPGASQITVDGNMNFWCFGVDSQYSVSGALHVAIDGLTMTRGEQTEGLSDGRGGAISYRNSSPSIDELTVEDCVIENSGGSGVNNGGIYAEDSLSVINTQIINNTSGIYISGPGPLDVSNSWIANNGGDGVFSDVDTILTNSTLSNNGAGTSGDGVYMGDQDATVTNCTFTGNHGRGFVINYQDTAVLTNSTLVGNVGSDLLSIGGNAIPRNSIVDKLDTQNGFGAITSQGNNLFGSAAPSGVTKLASDTSNGSVPSLLGALANNGGPTPTMAPTAAGSVHTSNKANPAFAPFLDECGFLRNPILPGIGAVESPSGTPNAVSLSPGSLVGIDQGLDYSQPITASGGTGTGYLVGLTAGALPPGFALSLGGALAGTATTAGSFTFTVTGFDSAGDFGSKSYTLNVNPAPSITTSSLPVGTENAAYSKAIQTSNGTGPFTWSYTGSLPSGVTFNTSTGTFGGMPDAGSAGTYDNIQVTATDSDGQSATQTYSLTVHWVIGLSPALPADTLNTAYNHSQTISGGSGTYSGLNVTGLPTGLNASLSGTTLTISGTPTESGTFSLGITLHDDLNDSDSNVASESLTVNAALGITTTSLPNWTETLAYSQPIATTGGTGPLAFSLSAGTLPANLNISSTTGVISGTPPVGSAGSYPFTVKVTDAAGAVVSQQYTVVISSVSLGAISFNQWTMNKTGFIGSIPASTGTGAFTLTMNSGKLPNGMTDSLSGGVITFAGTPTVAGTYNFALKLTDSLGVSTTQSYAIVVNPAKTLVWTGLGADDNWTTPGNWSGAGAAPLAGYTLIFGTGATQKTANNNFPVSTAFAALLFQDSGYTITGNNLKLSAGIGSTSTAGGTDTVGLNVALAATETFNIAGNTLIDVTGVISGTKFGVTKTGAGTLAFDSPAGNTYTGLTTVGGGTLQLDNSNQIADAASVTVNAGAVFELNGHDETIANLTLTGGTVNTGVGTLTLSGNVTSNAASSSAAINGKLNLIGVTPKVTVNNGTAVNDLVIAATISASSLTKLGVGTLVLSGNNASYTGTTKVSSGVLDVPNPATLGSGPVMALKGATLQLDGDGLTFGNALTLGGATLSNLAGSNSWTGPITDTATGTINVGAGQSLTLSGTISGVGGLTKSGTGTLLLPGADSYKGITTVKAGTLSGGGTIGTLLVKSGATFAPDSATTNIFKTGNATFSAGSTFAVTLNGTNAGTDYDQLSATGKVNVAGATLNVNLGFTPAIGNAFTLIQNDGTDAVVGTFAGLQEGATHVFDGMTFQISYKGGTGNDVVLTRTA